MRLHSLDIFKQYEKHQWQLRDLDFTAIRHDLIKPEYITLVRSAVIGESNVVAATHGLLNEFMEGEYDVPTFAIIWGWQEVQHHFAFKSWLHAVDPDFDVDEKVIRAMREPYPDGSTRAATLATNVASELMVNRVYRGISRWVEEPVLKDIFLRASRDESGHAREFLYFLRKRLETHPEEMASVLETLYVYVSPGDIQHPVSVFKSGLDALSDSETIDTGFDMFMAQVAGDGEIKEIHNNIRRVFSEVTGFDLSTNAKIRRALAECTG
ncbi:ferritin family protein [Longispora albida]|uniref:ferritin family protein n=1 Tax=Longispora albida TaxID=203523 RepID=UPI00036DC8DD|nr:ferritin family protein [Longispora albida]